MRALLPFAVAATMMLAACGGGDNDQEPTPDDADQPFMDTSAPQLSDTEYVAALCDGVEEWVGALNTRSTPEELREARDTLEAGVRALHPPEGAEDFQRDYVGYLDNAESEPTILVTTDPPLPEGELRERLSAAEATADCAYPFFARSDATPTATPGG
jgi:hypothetical protein